jgi:hypothetical protein
LGRSEQRMCFINIILLRAQLETLSHRTTITVLLNIRQLDIDLERLLLLNTPSLRVQKRNAAIRFSVLQLLPVLVGPSELADALVADGICACTQPLAMAPGSATAAVALDKMTK